ncbi:PorP/SprF family type IX secretion system membrane protein [Flavobacteriales bacterium AH-315-E23]|nr:PorP/SprF family type IX secretion system membrane protein [Flavobacteriales bacterium AH-315-E23]
MKNRYRILLITGFALILNSSIAQDIHFSQFYETPLLINPAMAGVIPGDIRVILNYKDQWGSVMSFPYRTTLISYDMGLFKKKWKKVHLGAGFLAFNDKAGKSEFGTTQVNFSLSGIVPLDLHHTISAGLQGGFAQRSISYTDLNWGDQFDGTGPNLPTEETGDYNTEPFLYGDFSAGVTWNYIKSAKTLSSNDEFKANAGIAFFHINKPKQQYYANDIEKLYSKLALHGKVYIGLKNTPLAVVPTLLYYQQGTSSEVIAGTMIRYMITEESKYTGFIKESAISFGGHIRVGDAFIPSVLLEIANFGLGISYDVNISGLKKVSYGKGGFEISLRYINPSPFRYGRGTKSGSMF